eukprot:gene11713-5630_t
MTDGTDFNPGDKVCAVKAFMTDSSPPRKVKCCDVGKVVELDNGDAAVDFGASAVDWIFKANLTNIAFLETDYHAGVVDKWHGRYGFVAGKTTERAYIHESEVIRGLAFIEGGSTVTYRAHEGDKGMVATNVRVVDVAIDYVHTLIIKVGGRDGSWGFIKSLSFESDIWFHRSAMPHGVQPVVGMSVTFAVQEGRGANQFQAQGIELVGGASRPDGGKG